MSGPEDGDPVVLLPAQGDWAPLRDALAHERRVYVPDMSSHGGERTAHPSSERMCDELLAFLDALGLERVDLAGRATGGEAAYFVAQAQPWRVARLVLEEVSVIPRRSRQIRPETVDVDCFLAPEERLRPTPDEWDAFRRITAPTLVLAGGPASHVLQERLAALAGRIPDARLTTIPVGHLVHAAAPQEFVRAVVEFLDGLPDGESAELWLAERGVVRTSGAPGRTGSPKRAGSPRARSPTSGPRRPSGTTPSARSAGCGSASASWTSSTSTG